MGFVTGYVDPEIPDSEAGQTDIDHFDADEIALVKSCHSLLFMASFPMPLCLASHYVFEKGQEMVLDSP